MPTKNNSKRDYKQQLKEIRPFVDFDYDLRQPLSSRAKGKINQYYQEIQGLTARPHQVYRPRRNDRRKAAQEFAQHSGNLNGITVAFIPTNGNEKRKIKFDKDNNISASSDNVESRVLPIDPHQIIDSEQSAEYINELLKQAPTATGYTILCGEFEIPNGYNKFGLIEKIQSLVNKYAKVTDEGELDNHHYKNWLYGIGAHTFKNQESFADYQAEKMKNKKALQLKRRNAKRRKQNKN